MNAIAKRGHMMEAAPAECTLDAIGELLLQLRLLKYDIEIAPAPRRAGRYLLARKNRAIRAIAVKTTRSRYVPRNNLIDYFHILAVVKLEGEESQFSLDRSKIYLIPRECLQDLQPYLHNIEDFALSEELVESLFDENQWVI